MIEPTEGERRRSRDWLDAQPYGSRRGAGTASQRLEDYAHGLAANRAKAESRGSDLPQGWEAMENGAVREFNGTEVFRAVWISDGVFFNMLPDGRPCERGVPVAVLRFLLSDEDSV